MRNLHNFRTLFSQNGVNIFQKNMKDVRVNIGF